MKRLFQPLAVAALGLALFSCDKSEPVNRTNGGELLGKPTRFEMSSSLGAVGIEPLSSNTDKADDELRANLHFRGLNSVAQTTLDAAKFGEGKPLQAHWAIKYAGGYYSEPCPVSKGADLTEPEKVQMKKSTVCFIGTNNSTIGGASVKMYTTTSKELKNITSSIMILDGSVTNKEDNKVYFTDGKSDPNHLIKGLKSTSEFQADRHIPIMTKLEPFAKMQVGGQDNDQVKFAPRGSLIGLNIKNTTGEQMIVTKIIVPKDGALYHRGHFEWANDAMPTFVGNNGSAAELAFPAEGTVANDAQACFYVWGFQDANKKGEAFKVQIAYKTSASGSEERTRTFSVYAPKSKVNTNEKMFDDGYAYNVVLTVNATNKLGGTAADWNDGGLLEVYPKVTFGGKSVSLGFKTPLDFLAEAPAINKAGDGFVLNHDLPASDLITNLQNTDVGYYTWDEAQSLFSDKAWLKDSEYYLANRYQWQSIIPYYGTCYSYFNKTQAKKDIVEDAQIGNTARASYTSEFISIQEGNTYVTYAIHFKGTDWVSAWRYSNKQSNGKSEVIIQCVPLKDKPTNLLNVASISSPSFFVNNLATLRTFPTYGYLNNSTETTISNLNTTARNWSSTKTSSHYPYYSDFTSSYAGINYGNDRLKYFTVRPFKKH